MGYDSMKIRCNVSAVTSALILIAVISLCVLFGLTRIDQIVYGELMSFGVRFSYQWVMPYMTYSALIIGFSWLNIIGSIALTYNLFKRRKYSPQSAPEDVKETLEEKIQHQLGDYADYPMIVEESNELHLEINEYDVTHPTEIVDSQC